MKTEINAATLASIRNPVLRAYAGRYVDIYQTFMEHVRESGLGTSADFGEAEYRSRLAELRKKGAMVRNDAKSV